MQELRNPSTPYSQRSKIIFQDFFSRHGSEGIQKDVTTEKPYPIAGRPNTDPEEKKFGRRHRKIEESPSQSGRAERALDLHDALGERLEQKRPDDYLPRSRVRNPS